MTISQITLSDVKSALRIDFNDDDTRLGHIMAATKATLIDWTGLTEAQLDEHDQLYILYMAVCQHMYDHGELTANKSEFDFLCRVILNQCMSPEVIIV